MSDKMKVFADKMTEVVSRFDNWTNLLTGLGTTRDKRMQTQFSPSLRLPDQYFDNLYHDDDMAARVCDVMPEEALRQGFSVKVPAGEDSAEGLADVDALVAQAKGIESEVMAHHSELETQSKVVEALVWANVFGGSAILLGAVDGASVDELAQPLDEDSIQSLSHLNVIDRRYMTPMDWYNDPTLPGFGKPKTYLITQNAVAASPTAKVSGGVLLVHESRMVVFGGVRTSLLRRQENGGWEDSLLQRMHNVLRQFGVGWDTLEHLMVDANQGVYRINGLIDALAAKDQAVITKRMQMIDMARSVIRAVVLDAEMETFERQNITWSGVEKPYELLMYRLAAAARMPVTILMGRSPAGENATGESDFRSFYDAVRAFRAARVLPALEKITKVMLLAKNGPTGGVEPDIWSIEFPPLWQMTPKEEAEIRKTQAEADHIYITDGVVTAEEVALSRFTADGWSPETSIDLAARLYADEAEEQKTETEAQKPETKAPAAESPAPSEAPEA